MWKRWNIIALAAVLIILAVVFLTVFSLRPGQGWGDDFALYIRQGQSLVDSTLNKLIDQNFYTTYTSSFKPGSVLYPWGYPLAIAGAYAVAGMNLFAFKLLNVCFFAGSLIPLYFLFKSKFSKRYTILLLLALAGFNTALTLFADNIISDLLFLCISNWFLWLSLKYIADGKYWINKYVSALVLALLIFAGFLVRTNGLLLLLFLGIICLGKLWRERSDLQKNVVGYVRRNFYLGLPVIFLVLFYVAFFHIFPDESGSHVELLSGINRQSLTINLKYYFELLLEYFRFWPVYIATLVLFVAGLWKHARKYWLLTVYFGLTEILYVVWPIRQGIRFIFPIIPVYLFFMLLGSEWLLTKIHWRRVNLHIVAAASLVVLFLSFSIPPALAGFSPAVGPTDGPYAPATQEMFAFVQNNLPADATYIFFKPRLFTWFTGRKSAFLALETELFWHKLDYMVINKSLGVSGDQVTVSQSAFVQSQEIVFQNSQFVIYRMVYPDDSGTNDK